RRDSSSNSKFWNPRAGRNSAHTTSVKVKRPSSAKRNIGPHAASANCIAVSSGCILARQPPAARTIRGGLPNRRTGDGERYRKIGPGFRTGENEPAAAHQELKLHGGSGGRDRTGNSGCSQAARGPLRQPHLL